MFRLNKFGTFWATMTLIVALAGLNRDGFAVFPDNYTTALQPIGTSKILVLLIEFKNYPHDTTEAGDPDIISASFFGDGTSADYPYESLRNYYERSSGGRLNLIGKTTTWHTTLKDQVDYVTDPTTTGIKEVIKEALDNFTYTDNVTPVPALDVAPYDNDGDGTLDYLIVLYTGPTDTWGRWTDSTGAIFAGDNYTVSGLKVGAFSWIWAQDNSSDFKVPQIAIHETGHALGLPNYDVGGLDMMDSNKGDHNCFSKFVLGWVTPTVVDNAANGAYGVYAWSWSPVMIMPGADPNNPFAEYFMVENRPNGNGNDVDVPGGGLIIWHVDATLNDSTSDFKGDNPLLSPMHADGATGGTANGRTFYTFGTSFGPLTIPGSTDYSDNETGVTVDNITSTGSSDMRANYYINDFGGNTKYSLHVNLPDIHRYGTVTPRVGLYDPNTTVPLVAIPEQGYSVRAWTGTDNNSSTENTNTVTMNKSKQVTVSFRKAPDILYSISASVVSGVNGHGILWPLALQYLSGTEVVVSCLPDDGYRVKAWTGTDNDSLKTNTNTVTMNDNATITVEFEVVPLAASGNVNGSEQPADSSKTDILGASKSLPGCGSAGVLLIVLICLGSLALVKMKD
ncbi:MAG: immune inhibitor A domain-containing protein [Phycisphaerae bacterium]